MKLKQPFRAACAASLLAACLFPATGRAQGVWNNDDDRNYGGDPSHFIIALWSYGSVAPTQGNNGHVGNWGGVPYPGSGGVTSAVLGAPGNTNCDVQVTLDSLTINPGSQLSMDGSSSLTVASTNVATDGTMVDAMMGGAFPIFTNAGTFRKSAGNGSYSIDPAIVFNSLPGSVIQVDSGSLQLPGNNGLFDTTTFNTAAGTLIDLVGGFGATTGRSLFQGTLTNTTGVGTVRLRANTMSDNYHTGQPLTLNFPGSVFQWVSGTMGGTGSGEVPVVNNVGTMNLSGADTKYCEAFITNKSLMIQSGAGNLDIFSETVTNAAGATYDLQSDAGIVTTYYGAFANAGLFKKSAGTGTSTISTFFSHLGGTVEVDSGTLLLPTAQHSRTSISTGGTFNVAANALLDLGSGEVFGGTYTGSGAGTVRMSAGVMPLDIDNNYSTTFNFPAGQFQWTGGAIGNYPSELFTNAGTMTLSGDAGKQNSATFTNGGTLIQTGAGAFDIGHFGISGYFINAAGALYDLQSDAGVAGDDSASFAFKNAGTFQKSGGTGTSVFVPGLKNSGTVEVKTGTLAFANTLYDITGTTLTGGTWNVFDGATLTFAKYASLTVNQAKITLSGPNSQFPALAGLADNQGSFSLLALRQFTTAGALSNEGQITLDAGSTLHVSGAYTGSSASTVAFTVGGTQSQGAQSAGVLQVNGAATLGGTLKVSLGAGVQLQSGDTVTIMAATGSLQGAFANVANGARINTADGTGSFQVNYGSGSTFNAKTVVLSGFSASGVVTHPAFFSGEVALGQGVYYLAFPNNSNIFGYYEYLSDPHYIYHFDLGFEYVFDLGNGGVVFYDFKSQDYFYTSSNFSFPYLYDFGLQAFLYYYPDPTNPQRYNTNGARYFYNFSTGQIISK